MTRARASLHFTSLFTSLRTSFITTADFIFCVFRRVRGEADLGAILRKNALEIERLENEGVPSVCYRRSIHRKETILSLTHTHCRWILFCFSEKGRRIRSLREIDRVFNTQLTCLLFFQTKLFSMMSSFFTLTSAALSHHIRRRCETFQLLLK